MIHGSSPSGGLPHFLVLGAMKAGTTSLLHYLSLHPHVAPPKTKEVTFFNTNYRRGVDWYRSHFPVVSPGCVTGEATPGYLFHEKAPARVREVLPEARLLVLLRDPVARAYSQYQHQRRHDAEPRSFREAIEAERDALTDGARRRQLPSTYLARGLYADQLRAWRAHFPAEQLLILEAERLFAEPLATLARIAGHLGIAPNGWDEQSDRIKPYNQRPYDAIAPADRAWLADYFRGPNERLRREVGVTFSWLEGGVGRASSDVTG